MYCRINDIKRKEVVNILDGEKIGYISDIDIDLQSGKLASIIIYGRLRFFGILGKSEDIIISWDKIEVIGEEIVLVSYEDDVGYLKKKRRSFMGIFSNTQ